MPPAPLWRRLAAMVYDSLLILAVWMITLWPLVVVRHGAVHDPAVGSLLFLELYIFLVYFWIRRGQTVGMLAWRLEIRTIDGGPFTLTRASLRFFAGLVSFLCLGLGYLWVLFDRQRRSWSDLASSSRVVYQPPGLRG